MRSKIFIILFLLLFLPFNLNAEEKELVTFAKCVDGDTASVYLDNKEITLRFLAVDTPETKHPTKGEEPFGKEASEYTCNTLKNAKNIEIEYDENSDKTDKYDRYLVWIFVDNELLQSNLIEKGLAKVAYLYDDYKYTEDLEELEKIAKSNKVGIWKDYEEKDNTIYIIICVVLIIIFLMFDKNYRNKTVKKVKKSILNEIKSKLE